MSSPVKWLPLTLICVVFLAAWPGSAQAQETTYFSPAVNWNGHIKHIDLRAELPAPKYTFDKDVFTFILDQDAFARLWGKWGLVGAAPIVDFEKNLVVVNTSTRSVPTVTRLSTTQVAKAMHMRIAQAVEKSGPDPEGFSYAIAVFDRAIILTIDHFEVPQASAQK